MPAAVKILTPHKQIYTNLSDIWKKKKKFHLAEQNHIFLHFYQRPLNENKNPIRKKKKRSYKIFYLNLSKRNQQKLVLNWTEGLEQREGESWVFLCLGEKWEFKRKESVCARCDWVQEWKVLESVKLRWFWFADQTRLFSVVKTSMWKQMKTAFLFYFIYLLICVLLRLFWIA